MFKLCDLVRAAGPGPWLYADYLRRKYLQMRGNWRATQERPDVARFSTQRRCGPVSQERVRTPDNCRESR